MKFLQFMQYVACKNNSFNQKTQRITALPSTHVKQPNLDLLSLFFSLLFLKEICILQNGISST